MNNQQPIKPSLDPEGRLRVHSIFYTIQGEGPFAGMPATFVRLHGCNLQCPGCDTEYTSKSETLTPEQIAYRVIRGRKAGKLVVITGGEPFAQNIGPAVSFLVKRGLRVQIETNGTLGPGSVPEDPAVFIVCSPKAGSINKSIGGRIDSLKYVLSHRSMSVTDGLPLRTLGLPLSGKIARPPKDFSGEIYLSPEDSGDAMENVRNLDAAAASCMRFGYRLCIQMHKIVGLE